MKHLIGHTKDELRALSEDLGQPAYRGDQLAKWLYEKGARDLEAMSDLPKAFREGLAAAGWQVPAL
ncbi:MAG: 23S rRNA (adenine(2503)-C(2))-methyltransferase RlmN, partial [Candidatus Sericytochromatia bacterium]|nr:23S rRNA (adenine(2503)-C(2))-methyltransferase RlmN [Candidatus Sericytochromatia bacterium]